MDTSNKAGKRPASRGSGSLAIHTAQLKRARKSNEEEIQTVLDFLRLPYQPLLETPASEYQVGSSSITRSASNLWDWTNVKRVDIMDHVYPEAYLEEFRQIFSLNIRKQPLAMSPPLLPDIDLCIVSERDRKSVV